MLWAELLDLIAVWLCGRASLDRSLTPRTRMIAGAGVVGGLAALHFL